MCISVNKVNNAGAQQWGRRLRPWKGQFEGFTSVLDTLLGSGIQQRQACETIADNHKHANPPNPFAIRNHCRASPNWHNKWSFIGSVGLSPGWFEKMRERLGLLYHHRQEDAAESSTHRFQLGKGLLVDGGCTWCCLPRQGELVPIRRCLILRIHYIPQIQ